MICSECNKSNTDFDPNYIDDFGQPKYYKVLTTTTIGKIIFCSPHCATAYNEKLRKENADRK